MAVHVPELDGVRGIAILMVLAYHMLSFRMRFHHWTGIAWAVSAVSQPFWLGVDLFFVLSGFLITGILLDGKGEQFALRKFFVRRALRILPLYYLVLAAIWFFYPNSSAFVGLGLVYMANTAPLFGVDMVLTPLWSLSVEEHFYLAWPWMVHFLERRTVALFAAGICVVEPALRLLAFPRDVYFYSWFRFDGLAYGALLACYIRSSWFTRERATTAIVVLAACAVAVAGLGIPMGLAHRHNPLGTALQFFPGQLLFSALVLSAYVFSQHGWTAPLRWPVLRLAGDLSYCMYLVHMLAADAFDLLFGGRSGVTFRAVLVRGCVVVFTTFVIALFSRRFVEMPARRNWKRFMPGGTGLTFVNR